MLSSKSAQQKIAIFLTCIFSAHSYASALYVEQQSVSAMGNAFAGAGAAGDDASITFYNPAGLILIEEGQMVGALTYAAADIVLEVDSATSTFMQPIPGAEGQEYFAVPQSPIPALHASVPLSPDWVIGMSIGAPFAAEIDYSPDALIRDAGHQATMIGYNSNISLAHQLTDKLSVGAGINAQYFDVKYNQYIGFVDKGALKDLALIEYNGSDLALYPNIGLLYEFSEKTRMGLSYRFPVTHDTEGEFQMEDATAPGGLVHFQSSPVLDASMEIPLPGIASLSFFHKLTPKIELLGDVTFEGWSRWQDITLTY